MSGDRSNVCRNSVGGSENRQFTLSSDASDASGAVLPGVAIEAAADRGPAGALGQATRGRKFPERKDSQPAVDRDGAGQFGAAQIQRGKDRHGQGSARV